MKNLLDHFTNSFVLEVGDDSFKPLHIFRKMVENYDSRLSFDDKILMFLHFEKYEYCLKLCRKRDLDSATFILKEIQRLSKTFPDFMQAGMDSLYYAMIAYYEYSFNRYPEALMLLDKAIYKAKIQGEDFPLMLGSICEQWLNKIRVYMKMNHADLISETTALFLFCLTGMYPDERVEFNFKHLQKGYHKLIIDHVINSVGEGILRMCKDNFDKANSLYQEVIISLLPYLSSDVLNQSTVEAIEIIGLYYKSEFEEVNDKMYFQFEAIQKSPQFIQKLLLIYYQKVVDMLGICFSTHPNYHFFREACKKLSIPTEILDSAI